MVCHLMIAAVVLAAPADGSASAGQAASSARRVAPMVAAETRASPGCALSMPRIEDRLDAAGRARIEAFLFRIEKAPDPPARWEASARLEPPSGPARTFHARPSSGVAHVPGAAHAAGAELRFDARVPVTPEMEGASRVTVTVTAPEGAVLFTGAYTFGYPRYQSSGQFRRAATTTVIRDDFDAPSLDERLWRVWISDPGRARVRQQGGRLRIDVTGPVGYNGLVSRVEMDSRDVELVCRAGIASDPQAKHAALVHLCGSGPLSPDHWLEVQLRDAGGGRATAAVNVAVPPEHRTGYRGGYDLPAAPSDTGDVIKVVCEGATNVCRGFAFSPFASGRGGEWWQLGDGFEVPARRARLEIKATGWADPEASSHLWFDDCRVYPRPQTHYVTVVLKRADGRPPGARAGGAEAGAPICFDAVNTKVDGCDLSVRLYDASGQRLVDEARAGTGFGYALLKLADSGWDLYPVGAVLRVMANGRQIGPDHVIASRGVDGLYPDDVYVITLD